MTILYYILAFILFCFIFYWLSRIQMKAWLTEVDKALNNKLEKYIPKTKKDDKTHE